MRLAKACLVISFLLLPLVFSNNVLAAQVAVSIPDTFATQGADVFIPIRVDNVGGWGIISAGIDLSYDTEVLSATGVSTTGTIASGWMSAFNQPLPGQILISMAGFQPLSQNGNLVNLKFQVKGSSGRFAIIHFKSVSFNDYIYPGIVNDGYFIVGTEPPQSRISVSPFPSIDFGSVTIGSSVFRLLTIMNVGAKDLVIDNLSSNDSHFDISPSTFPQKVQPDSSIFFRIRFTPSNWTVFNGTVTVASNDPTQPSVNVLVSGAGVLGPTPDIELPETVLGFGAVEIGKSALRDLVINNIGDADLIVTGLMPGLQDYAVESPEFPQTIPPQGSIVAKIRFSPSAPDRMDTVLVVNNNDPNENAIKVMLRGRGPVKVSAPVDSSDTGLSLSLPVKIEDNVSGFNVTSAEIVIHYDPSILKVLGVDAIETLPGAAGWGDPAVTVTSDNVRIALRGEMPLVGKGNLVNLHLKVIGQISGSISPLWFGTLTFNDGYPPAFPVNGSIKVLYAPPPPPPISAEGALVAANKEFGQGYAVAVHKDNRSSKYQWYFTKTNDSGGTWTPDAIVTPTSNDVNQGAVTMDATGKTHLVWWETASNTYYVYYSSYDGNNWSTPTTIWSEYMPNGNIANPFITLGRVEGVETIHVTFGYDPNGFGPDAANGYHFSSTDHGQTWSGLHNIGFDSRTDIAYANDALAADENGNVWVIYADNHYSYTSNDLFLRRSSDNGVNWTGDFNAEVNSIDRDDSPALLGSGSNLNMVYRKDQTGYSNYDLYYKYSIDGGSSWSSNTRMTTSSTVATRPFTVLGSDGKIGLVWSDSFGGVNEAFYMKIDSVGTILTERTLLSADDGIPSAVASIATDGTRLYVGVLDNNTGSQKAYVLVYAIPEITLSAQSFNFGNVAVGNSATDTLIVRNTGTASLDVTDITSDNPEFSPSVTSFAVAVGDSHKVGLRFSPISSGNKSATLAIDSNDPNHPTVTVDLSGIGVLAVVTVSLPDTSSLPGMITVPIRSTDLTGLGVIGVGLTLNYDSSVLTKTDISTTGTLTSNWSFPTINDLYPGELRIAMAGTTPLAGSGELIRITFKLETTRPDTTKLILTKVVLNEGNPTAGIKNGFIIPIVPDIEFSIDPLTEMLDFGTVVQPTEKSFKIKNVGTKELIVSSIPSSNALFEVFSPTFPLTITPGKDTTVVVKFSPPPGGGPASGHLTVNSDDPDEPGPWIAMSAFVPVPDIDLSVTSLDFGPVAGVTEKSFIIKNLGQTGLTVSSIVPSNSIFTITTPSLPIPSIGPSSQIEVIVRLAPGSGGRISANLTVNSDDPDESSLVISLQANIITGHNLALHSVWNLISFTTRPDSQGVDPTLRSIRGKYSVVMGEYGTYVQGSQFNTLSQLKPVAGYWIKMPQAQTATIHGYAVPVDTPLALHTAWNLIGYTPETELSVTTALSSLGGNYSIVSDEDGTYVVGGDPAYNTLHTMKKGWGYWIKMTAPGTLTYPGASTKPVIQATPRELSSNIIKTPIWQEFYGSALDDGREIKVGDLVTVLDPQGVLCGEFKVSTPGKFGYLRVYGDDPTSPEDEGAVQGDRLRFYINGRLASPQGSSAPVWIDNREITPLNLNTQIAVVSVEESLTRPLKFVLSQNYPNPFNSETVIGLEIADFGRVVLNIYSTSGQLIKTLINSDMKPGRYTVRWDGRQENGRSVASGIYVYRIEAGRFVQSRRMALIR